MILISVLLAADAQAGSLLLIDAIRAEPPNNSAGILRPRRGSDMQSVQTRFGEPLRKAPAVGKPPITRWYYGDYIVYFEYNKVLDTVILR